MSVQRFPEEVEAKDRAFYRRRTFVLWPWFFVAAAWAVLVFATLTHQTYLLNHQYLLQGSGLPWLAALEVFLLCWQVMTVAMMLPSSMPMLTLVVYASRRYHRPVAIPLAFLAGCWALMLVMFGVGVGSLAAMAVLTGVMVIEKAVPGGNRLSPLVGLALFLLAGVWLAHPLWLRIAIL
jgi:predicted metal-binding membrane protein